MDSTIGTRLLSHRKNIRKVQQLASEIQQRNLKEFLLRRRLDGSWTGAIEEISRAVGSGVHLRSDHLAVAIACCGRANEFSKAQWLYHSVHRRFRIMPSAASVRAMFQVAAQSGAWRFALTEIVRMDGLPKGRDDVLNQKTEAGLSEDGMKKGTEAYDEDDGGGVSSSAVTMEELVGSVIRACGQARLGKEDKVPPAGEIPDKSSRAVLWEQGLACYTHFRKNTNPHLRISPSPQILSALSRNFAESHKWDLCLKLAKACDRQGIAIPAPVYDNIVQSCHTAGRHREAVNTIERMLLNGLVAHEHTARMALLSCEERAVEVSNKYGSDEAAALHSNSWKLALILFNSLAQQGLPLVHLTYETALRACTSCGRWQEAALMLRQMKKDKLYVDPALYELVLSTRLSKARTIEEAFTTLKGSPVLNHSTRTYNHLLRCCLRSGTTARGYRKVLNEMKAREVIADEETLRLLVEILTLRGKWEGALQHFVFFTSQLERQERYKKGTKNPLLNQSSEGIPPEDFRIPVTTENAVLQSCEQLGGMTHPGARSVIQFFERRHARQQQEAGEQEAAGVASLPLTAKEMEEKKSRKLGELTERGKSRSSVRWMDIP